MPWERHWSSRRWARQRSAPHGLTRRPHRPRVAGPRGPPPPSPRTRTAGGSLVSSARGGPAWSPRAPRPAASRFIARHTDGPEARGARSGRTGAPPARRSIPRSAGLHRLSGRPQRGRPECIGGPRRERTGESRRRRSAGPAGSRRCRPAASRPQRKRAAQRAARARVRDAGRGHPRLRDRAGLPAGFEAPGHERPRRRTSASPPGTPVRRAGAAPERSVPAHRSAARRCIARHTVDSGHDAHGGARSGRTGAPRERGASPRGASFTASRAALGAARVRCGGCARLWVPPGATRGRHRHATHLDARRAGPGLAGVVDARRGMAKTPRR